MTLRYDTRSRVSTYTQSWVGGEPDFGAFESIATTTVGSTAVSEVVFSSIPANYRHLQIRGIARSSRTAFNSDPLLIQANSDTASNYSWHSLYGEGSAPAVASGATQSSMASYVISTNGATSNIFGGFVVDVLDYADTNKHKTFRNLMGFDNNGSGFVALNSGNWRSTSAITSIKLAAQNGNLVQYSSFALYGIKG